MGSDFSWSESSTQTTLLVSPTKQPEEVGSYILHFQVCLTTYPTQCGAFNSNVQITACVVTSVQVVRASDQASLSLQTYALSSTATFTYLLATKQTPNCGYPASGWSMTATGPQPTNLNLIDPTSGIYTVGPTTQTIQIGTYTVEVTTVIVNGITYGTTTLVAPSSFTLLVIDACATTIVTSSIVNPITLTVWDSEAVYPSLGAAFPDFTDSVSTANNDPAFCPKTYSAIVSNNAGGNSLTKFQFDPNTKKFTISSQNYNQIGTYNVTLTGEITAYPTQKAQTTLTITVVDPCLTTTLILPTQNLYDMTTSVMVASGPITQQTSVIQDQVSVSHGDSSGTQYCGARQYSITSTPNTATTALDSASLSIDINTGLISVQSSNSAHVGTHTVTVVVSLLSQTTITLSLTPFTLEIIGCIITSYTMASLSPVHDRSYVVSDPALSWSLLASSITTTQVPPCGYSEAITSVLAPDFVTSTIATDVNFTAQTRDLAFAGSNTISVTTTLIGYNFNPVKTAPSCSSNFVLTVVDPCLNTVLSVTPIAVENLLAFSGSTTTSLLKQTYQDSVSALRTLPTDTTDFCGNKSLSFQINGTSTQILSAKNTDFITLSPLKSTPLGVAQAQVIGVMQNYASITSSPISFSVTIVGSQLPIIEDQIYILNSSPLIISIGSFEIIPSNSNVGPSQIDVLVYQGSELPIQIDFQSIQMTNVKELDWISFDKATQTIAIQTSNSNCVGYYQVFIVQSFVNYNEVNPFTAFRLQVMTQTSTGQVVVSIPPYFQPEIQTNFDLHQGEDWQYVLPQVVDPQGSDTIISVELGRASVFMMYSNSKLSLKPGQEILLGQYQLLVTVSNKLGAKSTYTITLSILQSFISQDSLPNTEGHKDLPESVKEMLKNILGEQREVMMKLLIAENAPTFNWADQYLAALLNAKNKPQLPLPDVSILTVTGTGLVRLKFSQPMINPPLELIRNASVQSAQTKSESIPATNSRIQGRLLQAKEIPALLVSIKPGFYSKDLNFSMSYNITAYGKRTLDLTLKFDNPLQVSSMADPDLVEIKFVGNQYFFDYFGRTISANKTIVAKLPKQMDVKTAEIMKTATAVMKQSTNTIMAGNFVLNVVLSASLQQLWSMINTQQIVVLMPLFNIQMPANAQIFFGFVMELASFDILPIQAFYDRYLPTPFWDQPLNERFDVLGFSSTFFLNNMGSIVFGIAAIPLLTFVLLVLKPFARYSRRITSFRNKLHGSLFWSHQITLLNESYSMVAMCALINALHITFDSKCEIVNSALTFTFIVLWSALPLVICVFLLLKLQLLDNELMKKKFGALVEGLDISKGSLVVLTPINFLIRRLALVAAVVLNRLLITQILTVLAGCFVSVVSIGFLESHIKRSTQLNELFNEVIIVLTLYTMMCFTFFLPDEVMLFYVGYIACLLVVLHLLINLSIMIVGSLQKLILYFKRGFYRLQHRKHKKTEIQPDRLDSVLSSSKVRRKAKAKEIFTNQNSTTENFYKPETQTKQTVQQFTESNPNKESNQPNLQTPELGQRIKTDQDSLRKKELHIQNDFTLKRRGNAAIKQRLEIVNQSPVFNLKRRFNKLPEIEDKVNEKDDIFQQELMRQLDDLFPLDQTKTPQRLRPDSPRDSMQLSRNLQLSQYFYQ